MMDNGRTRAKYLHPNDARYNVLFFKNLIDKYNRAVQYKVVVPGNLQCDAPMHLRVLSQQVRPKLIEIKAGTPAATKVKGYTFDFEAVAPRELLQVGYLGGFGGQSAMGFGACKILKS